MAQIVKLTAEDGHVLDAYRADPVDTPKGAVVVVQEIFGVNRHIRTVCDRFAKAGYVAIAPALFDRFQRGFESGYSPAEITVARAFLGSIDWDAWLKDVAAARDAVAAVGSVSIVGFCLGGSVAFLAATRLDGFAAAVGFYGGQIARHAHEKPRIPTQLHFGENDQGIPLSDVEAIRARRPGVEIHLYPAGHGFNCDERESYHEPSAMKARERSLAFLDRAMR